MTTEFKFDGTKLLEGVDLPEGRVFELEIEGVIPANTAKAANKTVIDKPIIVFKKENKNQFIIGKTCERVIKMLYGGDFDDWIGETIRIQRRYLIEAFGCRNCAVIRVIPPKGSGMSFRVFKQMGSAVPFDDDGKPIVREPKKTKKEAPDPSVEPKTPPATITAGDAEYIQDAMAEIGTSTTVKELEAVGCAFANKSEVIRHALAKPYADKMTDFETEPEKEVTEDATSKND